MVDDLQYFCLVHARYGMLHLAVIEHYDAFAFCIAFDKLGNEMPKPTT